MKIKNKIDLMPAIYFLILFPFIQQRSLDEVPGIVPTLYKVASFFAACCIYFSIAVHFKMGVRKHIWVFIPYWAAYYISTVIGSLSTFHRVVFNSIILFSLVLFVYLYIRRNPELLMRTLSYIYGGFIFLNMVLDFIFPQGLYKTQSYHAAHLLGDDNAIVFVALPGLAIMSCYSIMKHGKISWLVWAEIAITAITLLRLWSVSAMMMVIMFIAMLIFTLHFRNINSWILFSMVIVLMIVVLFGLTNVHVQNFIVNVLHKDVTLSNRTIIWNLAFKDIAKHPFLGYGGYYEAGRYHIGELYTYSSHTPYIQMLLDGGILLLGSFFIIPIAAFRHANQKKHNVYIGILSSAMTCMMVNYITEQVRFFHLFLIAAIMMNIDALPNMDRRMIKTYGKENSHALFRRFASRIRK